MNFRTRRQQSHKGKPQVLSGRDIPSLARYIKSGDCRNVIFMLGAGVSTSAGIPDFRSPETGLYSNLARLNLPHPEAVFEIGFFRKNPVPFYTLAHELYPGRFRPTPTHSFIRLLSEKELLHTCFTQNIDTLERRAGVPGEKIIEAHGSFATQRCIDCRKYFDDTKMKEHILAKKIARCEYCRGYVKPDIVFFGERLPNNFLDSLTNMIDADLLIIMGTSLTVQPFASLADLVKDSCPRVLINMDHVGSLGSRPDDVVLLGKCDEIVTELCKELGWEEELDRLWNETAESVIVDAVDDSQSKPKSQTLTVEEKAKKALEKSNAMKKIEERLAALDLEIEAEAANKSAEDEKPSSKSTPDNQKETIEESSLSDKPASMYNEANNEGAMPSSTLVEQNPEKEPEIKNSLDGPDGKP